MKIIKGVNCHAVHLNPRILDPLNPGFLSLVHLATRQDPIFKKEMGFLFLGE